MQRGTDIQLLQQLAGRNGFECFVETEPRTGLVQGHFPQAASYGSARRSERHMGDQSNVNSLSFERTIRALQRLRLQGSIFAAGRINR